MVRHPLGIEQLAMEAIARFLGETSILASLLVKTSPFLLDRSPIPMFAHQTLNHVNSFLIISI